MTPEGPKPSEYIDLKPLLLILGVAFVSQFAFSKNVRKQIFNRDQGKSKWSNEPGEEAAHVNHSKSSPDYNTPENGRMLTKREHYIDHYNRAGRNGLSIAGNIAALRLIWKRLTDTEKRGLPEPPEEQNW